MNWKAAIVTGLMLLVTVTLYAQTPDGETPPNEAVCDSESGAAYGLCTAYCEAMDCDYELTSTAEMSCLKVRDRFIQQTGRDVPCEPVECPCFDESLIGTFQQITNDPSPRLGIEEGEYHCVLGGCNGCIGLINPTADPVGNTCSVHTSAPWENEPFRIEPRVVITAEEAQSCVNILISNCQ